MENIHELCSLISKDKWQWLMAFSLVSEVIANHETKLTSVYSVCKVYVTQKHKQSYKWKLVDCDKVADILPFMVCENSHVLLSELIIILCESSLHLGFVKLN